MPRVPVPLTWKRKQFAVLEPMGMVDRLHALAVTGFVAGPFAVYGSPYGAGHILIHLPSQTKIIDLRLQSACKDAAEKFAALDINWWTCIREDRLKPQSWVYREERKEDGP